MDKDAVIEQLRKELEKKDFELRKAIEKLRELADMRTTMLYTIEDVNQALIDIERSKKEWEATFDSISDPLFIHDKEMRLVKVNRAYLTASGEAKFKNIIGRPYFEVFPKLDAPFKGCRKALELQEEEEEEEEEILLPSINKVFKVRFYPINDENGRLLYSIHILEDITETKRAAERLKEEVEITSHLLMIAEATAGMTDVNKLMEQVVHCSHEVLGCNICLAYLWSNEERLFMPVHALGLPPHLIPIFMTEPIKEKDYLKGISQAFKDLLSWSRELAVGSVVSIPLTSRNEYLGLIIGIFSNKVELSDRHMKVVSGISHLVSVALEEAKLYRNSIDKAMELSHKIETIKVMHEIDRSILSTLKSDEILETVTRLLSRVIPCESATVVLIDRERDGVTYKAGFGTVVMSKGAFVPFADTSARVVFETGRAEYLSNLPEIRPLLPIEKRFLDEGFLSQISVPITIKGDVAGILTVGAKRVAGFTKEDLSTLEYLCSQIGVGLENAGLISDLEELFISVVKSLSSAIDAKSPWTAGHSERVTKYALDIAKQMGLSEKELKNLELAGLLHDVGKIGTYESILDKPAKLTDEELTIMRQHPVKGADILAPIKQLKDIIPCVKYHHEFYDGTGYPDGLKGEAIPLYARILTVADTVDAMGADRPYRKGRAMDVIIGELKRCSGTQFDLKVVEAFLKVLPQKDIV